MKLDHLNTEQQLAVTADFGPVCVLAGAGTGKTRVLTNRIVYLIDEMNVEANQILAMTFTKKAAQEMQKRIVKMIDIKQNHPCITTIHAFCLQVISKEILSVPWLRPNFKVADAYQMKMYYKQMLKRLNITEERFKNEKDKFFLYLREEKTMKHLPEQATNNALFKEMYRTLQSMLITDNVLSFDDMLFYTSLLFNQNAEVLQKYQEKFSHILVDEYQDTSPLQFDVISNLAAKHKNLYVVGDNDQAIYGFRGADMGIILSFQNTFPDAQVFKLEENYRSVPSVITSANAVIKNNFNRFDKKLLPTITKDNKVKIIDCLSQNMEAEYVANIVKKHKKYDDIAIIVRNNFLTAAFEKVFRKKKIPFIVWGDRSFFEREEVLDIIAYLELMIDGNLDSFSRIINRPSRYIGKTTKNAFVDYCNIKNIDYAEAMSKHIDIISQNNNFKSRQVLALHEFYAKFLKVKNNTWSATEAIDKVMHDLNYRDYISNIDDVDIRGEKLGNIFELKQMADEFEKENGKGIKDFVSYFYHLKNFESKNDEVVKIMTAHKSKGLEFPIVFVSAANDEYLPSKQSIMYLNMHNSKFFEEERRLFYVAITRAMQQLYITSYVFNAKDEKTKHSRFIDEIPDDVSEYTIDSYLKTKLETIEDVDFKVIQTCSDAKSLEDFTKTLF